MEISSAHTYWSIIFAFILVDLNRHKKKNADLNFVYVF